MRTSTDGVKWTNDWGCLDDPQTSEHCHKFNLSAMVAPDKEDPPDLEFYRIRPFLLGASGRLVAHVLDYAPSPAAVVHVPGYGRQPLWDCNKDGCCHGPHMYEEWWLGPSSGDPRAMSEWRRPFRDTPAAPHDAWIMAQPVTFEDMHVWVADGKVYGLPLYRLAGIHSPANGEFSSPAFAMPDRDLMLNADALWSGGNGVGGADEVRLAALGGARGGRGAWSVCSLVRRATKRTLWRR